MEETERAALHPTSLNSRPQAQLREGCSSDKGSHSARLPDQEASASPTLQPAATEVMGPDATTTLPSQSSASSAAAAVTATPEASLYGRPLNLARGACKHRPSARRMNWVSLHEWSEGWALDTNADGCFTGLSMADSDGVGVC